MSQTELCSSDVCLFDLLHDLDEMASDASLELSNGLVV